MNFMPQFQRISTILLKKTPAAPPTPQNIAQSACPFPLRIVRTGLRPRNRLGSSEVYRREASLRDDFIFADVGLPIIIKQGPKSMYYYSFFNPLDMQSVVWTFLHPVQQTNLPNSELQNNSCSAANFLSGSANQETKDANSPTTRGFESLTSMEFISKIEPVPEKKRRIKQKKQEEEFKPNVPEAKKCRKTPQNANRNVVPNIMHQVISFFMKKNRSQKMVEKIMASSDLPEKCSVERYYLYQKLIKDKLNHYVNVQSLDVLKNIQESTCVSYSGEEQRYYNKISLVLAHYFLSREFDSLILTSKRVSQDMKLEHLKTKRIILFKIKGMLNS